MGTLVKWKWQQHILRIEALSRLRAQAKEHESSDGARTSHLCLGKMTIATARSDAAPYAVRLLFGDEVEELPSKNNAWDAHGTDDAASIPSLALYNKLVMSRPSSSSQTLDDLYVSIELPRHSPARKSWSGRGQLPSLIVRVNAPLQRHGGRKNDRRGDDGGYGDDNNDTGGDDDDDDGVDTGQIVLHPAHRRFFDEQSLLDAFPLVNVRPHHPVFLSRVTLAATTPSTLESAQHDGSTSLRSTLHGRLIRQGDLIQAGDGQFRVVMCEPTLQGIIQQDVTDMYVAGTPFVSRPGQRVRTSTLSSRASNVSQESLVDASGVVVDEHFLAHGILDNGDGLDYEGALDYAGFADGVEATVQICPIDDAEALEEALSSWGRRAGQQVSEMDLQSCLLLDEAAFPAMAAVEGDWALVALVNSSRARIVKLLCAPRELTEPSRLTAYVPPLLLQNLNEGKAPTRSSQPQSLMMRTIGSRKEGSVDGAAADVAHDCPLPLPFADALTISRVAGPLSINRRYQTLFLSALRDYFQSSRRIIQRNDVIAVKFDKFKMQWAAEGNEEGNEDDSHDTTLPNPWSLARGSEDSVVYFQVTDVLVEVANEQNKDLQGNHAEDWLHDVSRAGQYGCIVDTALTKMVQSGTSQLRVSDTSAWLDTVTDIASIPGINSPLLGPESAYTRLLQLVQATLIPHAADYGLHLSVLLKGARGTGKRTVAHWVARALGVHVVELNCFDLIGDTDARTEGVLRARFAQAADCGPAILLLRHIDALARKSQSIETGQEPAMAAVLQDCLDELKQATQSAKGDESVPVAVFGTTGDAEKCPTGVLACFRHEIPFDAPNEGERNSILESLLANTSIALDVSVKSLATQTAALVAADLVDLVKRAQLAAIERVMSSCQGACDADLMQAGVSLTGADFDDALNKTRQSYSDNIGAPKIPNVTWDDVGGLASVKGDIMDTIQLPLDHPELFADGLKKRSGILLYGPPGTGKTLLAKAVATSCSLNFFSVKGPELLNMYIGESEANVRRVFQRARDAKPCVIFFDELDSIAPKRGNQGDSGGVMDRIVSQLLAELDGMSSGQGASDVFVIGATNRPDLLDPALLRPGRFDRMLYLAVSGTHAEQLNILQALTRKFKLDSDVGDLGIIAQQCPLNLTGADFYALCSDAMLKSMTRKAEWIDGEVQRINRADPSPSNSHPHPITTQYYLDEVALPADLDVRVSRSDFEAALRELVPSVSAQEMEHYRSVQARFSSTDTETMDAEPTEERRNGVALENTPHARSDKAITSPSQGSSQIQTIGDLAKAVQDANLQGVPSAHPYDMSGSDGKHAMPAANGHHHSPPLRQSSQATTNGAEEYSDSETRGKGKGKGKARE